MRYAILLMTVLISINSSAFCQGIKRISIGLTGGFTRTTAVNVEREYLNPDEVKAKYYPLVGCYLDIVLTEKMSISFEPGLTRCGFRLLRSTVKPVNPIGYDINTEFECTSYKVLFNYKLSDHRYLKTVLFGLDVSKLESPETEYVTEYPSFEISGTRTNLDRYMGNWNGSLVLGASLKVPVWQRVSLIVLGEYSIFSPAKDHDQIIGNYLMFPNAFKILRFSLLTRVRLL